MKKEWLSLRFFDERNDLPRAQTHVFLALLLLMLQAVIPVGMSIAAVMTLQNDPRSALMWGGIAVAASLCAALVEIVNRRSGHARNQLILTALLALMVALANA